MENKSVIYRNLDIFDVTKHLNNYIYEKDNSDSKPDIKINCDDTGYFFVKWGSIGTGIGGFKNLLKEVKGLDMFKVSYNGIILNKEEKQDLYERFI